MAKKILATLDMTTLEIINHRLHSIAGNHGSPVESLVWYDSTAKRIKFRTNSANLICVTDGGDLSAGSVVNTALATNPLARSNHTGTQVASTISDFDTQVRTNRLNQMTVPNADVAWGGFKITGLATPTAGTDAANKQYVDDMVAGLAWKDAVRVASTANVALSGLLTIDGITVIANDRVLLKNQSAPAENGIWLAQSGAWSRALDADASTELHGMAVMVEEGTANNSTQWVLTTDTVPIVVGTTSLAFSQFGGASAYTAGNGLTLSTNDFNVGPGNGILVTADTVTVDPAVVVRKFAGNIGDNSTTALVVTHNLNTKDITYSIRAVSDDSFVDCDVVSTSVNTATFTFAVAPTTNQYRVVIHG